MGMIRSAKGLLSGYCTRYFLAQVMPSAASTRQTSECKGSSSRLHSRHLSGGLMSFSAIVGTLKTAATTVHGGAAATSRWFNHLDSVKAGCAVSPYPKQYKVSKLGDGESLKVDGKLDDGPWLSVPWSSPFEDIEGSMLRPPPRFETKFKMLYDDEYLYVGAYLEEPQAWANLTQTNSVVYHDNDFEIFIDPDGSTHRYKEIEVNALGTVWTLLLVRPYLNGGPAVCNFTQPGQCSLDDPSHGVGPFDLSTSVKLGVHVNGTLNDPTQGSYDWTLEVGLPLKELARYENVSIPPKDGDYWRINFSRVQYKVDVHNDPDGKQAFWKRSDEPDNWVWQPQGVVQMHLPERWGYLRFTSGGEAASVEQDPLWPVRDTLHKIYTSEKAFDTLYGQTLGYTESLMSLHMNAGLPGDVVQGLCSAGPPVITMGEEGHTFEARVPSREVPGVVGHINHERLIWFTR